MARILLLFLLSLPALAENFSVTDTQGNPQNLSSYKGKWVLVNFWATWCPPCRQEIPELSALHVAHKSSDLVVIGIAVDYKDPKTVTEFATKHDISYPVVLGDKKVRSQFIAFSALPSSYIYDRTGKLVAAHSGAITREDVENFIQSK